MPTVPLIQGTIINIINILCANLKSPVVYSLKVCVCVYVWCAYVWHVCPMLCVRWPKENIQELTVSLYHVSTGDRSDQLSALVAPLPAVLS